MELWPHYSPMAEGNFIWILYLIYIVSYIFYVLCQVIPYGGLNFDPQIWYKRNKRNPFGKEIASYDKYGRGYSILDVDPQKNLKKFTMQLAS